MMGADSDLCKECSDTAERKKLKETAGLEGLRASNEMGANFTVAKVPI
jgi:hypothetical protein